MHKPFCPSECDTRLKCLPCLCENPCNSLSHSSSNTFWMKTHKNTSTIINRKNPNTKGNSILLKLHLTPPRYRIPSLDLHSKHQYGMFGGHESKCQWLNPCGKVQCLPHVYSKACYVLIILFNVQTSLFRLIPHNMEAKITAHLSKTLFLPLLWLIW